MLNPTDHVEPNLDIAAAEVIDGEAIIINLATGVYYSMPGVGGDIWSMIASRQSVASMTDHIAAAYEVDAAEARRDLHALLDELLAESLILLTPNGNGAHPPAGAAPKKAYTAPVLQIYRDMEELLALDPPTPGMNEIVWKPK
jgi:hypothetical protein